MQVLEVLSSKDGHQSGDRDDATQPAALVGDGQLRQAVRNRERCRALLVHVLRSRYGDRLHDLAQATGPVGRDKATHIDPTAHDVRSVDDVDGCAGDATTAGERVDHRGNGVVGRSGHDVTHDVCPDSVQGRLRHLSAPTPARSSARSHGDRASAMSTRHQSRRPFVAPSAAHHTLTAA